MKKSLHKGKTENNPHQIWKVTLISVKTVQIKAQLKPLLSQAQALAGNLSFAGI